MGRTERHTGVRPCPPSIYPFHSIHSVHTFGRDSELLHNFASGLLGGRGSQRKDAANVEDVVKHFMQAKITWSTKKEKRRGRRKNRNERRRRKERKGRGRRQPEKNEHERKTGKGQRWKKEWNMKERKENMKKGGKIKAQ